MIEHRFVTIDGKRVLIVQVRKPKLKIIIQKEVK
jgi:hypothetical protein